MNNCSLSKLLPSLSESQCLNLLAIDLLEKTGNNEPTQAEIDATESFFVHLRSHYKGMPFKMVVDKIRETFFRNPQ